MEKDRDLKKMKVLIMEKNGPQLASRSNHTDPYKPEFCGRKKCFPCSTASKPTRGSCWVPGASYRIDCLSCVSQGVKAIYHGESGHSCHYRGLAHLNGLERNMPNNVMVLHNTLYHGGKAEKMSDFRMTLESVYRRQILCQSREGLAIQANLDLQKIAGRYQVIIMNSRNDFHQPGIVRSTYTKLLQ